MPNAPRTAPRTAPARHPAVVELRQYTLLPGRRDELIDLFEREFVESQEATGMTVLGRFRDLDDPDRFVWLRGFPDMETRREALSAFYGGPAWAAHGPRANATMADSDDVLLLRPLPAATTAPDVAASPDPFVSVALWHFPPGDGDGPALIHDRLAPLLRETGPAPLAVLVTETAANTFPRLPVRTGENVVAVITAYPDELAHRRHLAATADHPRVRDEIRPAVERAQSAAPLVLRLTPTDRSCSA
ncbi:NIPSNAP family protein [Streptomyces sp. NPDC056202]|uniref:NIPSNAP family protein n=1 Tax=Streptomyces sp. NPDC056202 TaxID=3345745 RepID=UPI0035E1AB71